MIKNPIMVEAGKKAAETKKRNKLKNLLLNSSLKETKLYSPDLIPIKSKVHKTLIECLLSPLTPHKNKSNAANDIIDFHGSNFNIARFLLDSKKWEKSKICGVENVEEVLTLQKQILKIDKKLAKFVELNKGKERDMKRYVILSLEYKRALGAILYDACATLTTNKEAVEAILYADYLQKGVIAQFTFATMFDKDAPTRLETMIKKSGRWEFVYIKGLPKQSYKGGAGTKNVPTYQEQSFQGEKHTTMCTTIIRKIV